MAEGEDIVKDPEEYYMMLQGMYLEDSDIDISDDFEARSSLVKLKRLRNDVNKLRREITKDMRTIRTMYLDESIIEKPKILGLFSFQKKLTHTEKRKKLINEREKSLIPYNNVIEMIDGYIKEIEDLEKYIQNEALETYSPPKYTKVHKENK
ncbi:MAG TPA: hypothetical protein VK426_05070 [Methanobacterium sp.]|nr:hypothetical protein [Methanobacterium sp.]